MVNQIQLGSAAYKTSALTLCYLSGQKGVNVLTIRIKYLYLQVTCLACDNKSNTIEPFWDLSLEFPERYQCSGKDVASQPCLVTEMLAKFTETEALEGKVYVCDECNCE